MKTGESVSKLKTAVVKSVVPLTAGQRNEFEMKLRVLFGEEVTITNELDRQLLGGFTVRVGDWFLDASVIRDLQKII